MSLWNKIKVFGSVFLILTLFLAGCSNVKIPEKELTADTGLNNQPFYHDSYHCYPDKGFCRLNGNLNNPKVPINEVIG